MDDFEKWKICQLGTLGGFSHKFVASLVFDTPTNKVTAKEIRKVQCILYANEILITEWRDGITPESKRYASSVTSGKKKKGKAA